MGKLKINVNRTQVSCNGKQILSLSSENLLGVRVMEYLNYDRWK